MRCLKLAISKSKLKYRLQRKLSRGGCPTELYHQLRGVAGTELSASLGVEDWTSIVF